MLVRYLALLFVLAIVVHTNAQDTRERPKSEPSSGQVNDPQSKRTGETQQGESPRRDLDPDREVREVFFKALAETRSRGEQEFGYLLFQKSVRDEIGLNEESAKAAREVLGKTRASGEKLFEQLKSKSITNDELKIELQKVMESTDKEIWKVLVDGNVKCDRLLGLFVQHRSSSAVLNKVVAQKVGLDEAVRLKMVSKKDALEREMFEVASQEGPNGGPADRFRIWEKYQKKIDTAVSEMLTAEQRAKLEALKGEPFEFEQMQFMPPGPPRGRDGGGRDGRRDGNRPRNQGERRDERNQDDRSDKCREGDKLVTDQH